jgi:PncC family amidohydrolase
MIIEHTSFNPDFISTYLHTHKLVLTTAESCTAGTIVATLADIEGCGAFMDCGYVTYSQESKQRLLKVRTSTIDRFTLSSEEVAREMAIGALNDSTANVAVATTGVAGPEPMDGIPPGIVCVAWAYQQSPTADVAVFSRKVQLQGDRQQIRKQASNYAINGIVHFHRQLLDGIKE